MIRAAGVALIALGALLVLPQIFRDEPDLRLILLGILVALIGGLLLCDCPAEGGPDGHARS